MTRIKCMWMWICTGFLILCAGCTATPLPLPPEMAPERMVLFATVQDHVFFQGTAGAVRPEQVHQLLVTNRTRGGSTLFATDGLGAFVVTLAGELEDIYLFSSRTSDEFVPILECTTDGAGGVRDTDTPPDEPDPADSDGDGFAAGIDCDDSDSSVHPGAIELCDGVDNNCDGVFDEGCELCTVDSDCSDGFFCNGAESCAGGLCEWNTAIVCDDGDPATLDYCSEVDASCIYE